MDDFACLCDLLIALTKEKGRVTQGDQRGEKEQAQGCTVRPLAVRAAGVALGRNCEHEPGAPRITGFLAGLWTWLGSELTSWPLCVFIILNVIPTELVSITIHSLDRSIRA